MRVRRSRLAGLTLSLALLAVLAFVLPASASAARILYASGHDLDPTRLATFGGNTVVAPGEAGFDGCSDSEWAAALGRTDFDILMVGEDAANDCGIPLSDATLTAIANYVRNGKPIIFTGAHADENDLLNAIFGFSTTNAAEPSETDTASLQPGAVGTPFAGGPATIAGSDLTEALGSTPGTAIYAGSTPAPGTWVFTVPFGLGTVTYLGWDFSSGLDANVDDWYRVVDRATKVNNAFTIVAITRNKKKGTATITGNVQFPGELIASGKGVKSSSADRAVISRSVGAGQAQLLIKAKGKKKKKLNQKGKAKLNLAITYTATGGSPKTQSVKVKLKKKLKKK